MSVRDNRLCDRVISGMPVENWIFHHETTSLPKILNFNVVCDTLRYRVFKMCKTRIILKIRLLFQNIQFEQYLTTICILKNIRKVKMIKTLTGFELILLFILNSRTSQ